MHRIMLKIEVQCPKIIAKLYKDIVTPMEHQVAMSSLQMYDPTNLQYYVPFHHR